MQQTDTPNTDHNGDENPTPSETQMVVFHGGDTELALLNTTSPPVDVLNQLEAIKQNNIAGSTRNQYLSANRNLVIFLFRHHRTALLPAFADSYHEASQSLSPARFGLFVKESLDLNRVCPIDINVFTNDMFMAYLLSLKRPDGTFYTFSSYDLKRPALMFLLAKTEIYFTPVLLSV